MADYVFADCETANGGLEYSMPPHQFVRLFQWAHNDGPVQTMEIHTEEDLEVVRNILRGADYIVFHNGISADLPWIFGVHSLEPLKMAMQRKVVDTFVVGSLVTPAPNRFTAPNGHTFVDADKPGTAMKWLSLENLCYQFGLPGKLGDLKELAKRHNPPGTKVADLDFSLIPLDDPDFLAYADQDVIALRGLFYFLMGKIKQLDYNREYIWDELESAAAMEVMSRNGILVDQDWAHTRISEMDDIRQEKMAWLVEEYGFPTEGKAPWASAKGKEVILQVLADFGVTEKSVPDWPRTPTGSLKLGGEDLLLVTEGFSEEAQEFAQTIAILKGQRTLPQLVLDSMKEDGRVHPQITSLQRSGRWCLPETHKLLTRRGILHIDDVRVGDETLDMRNNWVKITNIARFQNAEVHKYETRSTMIESTPEHRWVQYSESSNRRKVEPLRKRSVLQLTPDSYPFDPHEARYPADMTERERIAALVGLLVTDGTAVRRSDAHCGRFGVYQTEDKFYEVFQEFLGDLVTNDYSRSVFKNPSNTIHEMRLVTPRVQAILDAEGLHLEGGHLRHSSTLLPWLLGLNMGETQAFLTSVYLSDGNMRSGGTQVSTLNENIIPVIQMAAYRCGRRSNYREYYSDAAGRSGRVALLYDRVNTRHFETPEVTFQDVWCVETETGTFTAWYPEGRWSGPYLTGNSVTKPGVTIFGSNGGRDVDKSIFIAGPGNVLAGFDYSNADPRAMAALSGDEEFAIRFTENDPETGQPYDGHNLSGEALFGKEVYYSRINEDGKPLLRPVAKAAANALNYNVGPVKLAATLNTVVRKEQIDIQPFTKESARAMIDQFNSSYPWLKAFKDRAAAEGESKGYIEDSWGRRMQIVRERSWTMSPALYGQGAVRNIMRDAILKIVREGGPYYARALRAVIHDELLMELEESRLEQDIVFIKRCMETVFHPPSNVSIPIPFPVGFGYGRSWRDAAH